MANQEHLDIIRQGVEVWNRWRKDNAAIRPDLSEANLSEANLNEVDLYRADLRGANLSKANLSKVDLRRANLSKANLSRAILVGANLARAFLEEADLSEAVLCKTTLMATDLRRANLKRSNLKKADLSESYLYSADLSQADLSGANLVEVTLNRANLRGVNLTKAFLKGANLKSADLSQADLSGADLSRATLIDTNLEQANLSNCMIYGLSVWDVRLEGAIQFNLVITPASKLTITVDSLEVAQFIYLLLNNKKIRDVIDTITSKVVLILGRFTPERKAILDALREELRKHNYTPVLFDFERPASRDFTETARTLAHLARFIIADLTDPSSIPQELQAIVPDLEVPVQPLLLETKREYAMFVDFRKYDWVLPIYLYNDRESLIASLKDEIIELAEKKARELAIEKVKRLEHS